MVLGLWYASIDIHTTISPRRDEFKRLLYKTRGLALRLLRAPITKFRDKI